MHFPIIIKPSRNVQFFKQRYIAYSFSIIVTLLTVFMLFFNGLNLGIDFTGGVIIEIKTDAKLSKIRSLIGELGYHGANIQNDNSGNTLIRLKPKNLDNYQSEIALIKLSIINQLSPVHFRKVDYVGSKIGNEFITKSIVASILSLVAMMIYITLRFNFIHGVGVIIALCHDAMATIGFYSISRFEFDLTSVAAILTIIGYSVNDSVVIYDRIRENFKKHPKWYPSQLINTSINETLSRTIMTAATTLIVCASIFIFGGEALKGFGSALFFGIAFGTYSSIYLSAPLLTLFIKRNKH